MVSDCEALDERFILVADGAWRSNAGLRLPEQKEGCSEVTLLTSTSNLLELRLRRLIDECRWRRVLGQEPRHA